MSEKYLFQIRKWISKIPFFITYYSLLLLPEMRTTFKSFLHFGYIIHSFRLFRLFLNFVFNIYRVAQIFKPQSWWFNYIQPGPKISQYICSFFLKDHEIKAIKNEPRVPITVSIYHAILWVYYPFMVHRGGITSVRFFFAPYSHYIPQHY